MHSQSDIPVEMGQTQFFPKRFFAAWFLYKGPEEGKILCFLLPEQLPSEAEDFKQTGATVPVLTPQHSPSPCQAHLCFILIKTPSKPELADRKCHL